MMKNIKEYIERTAEETKELLFELCAIPSPSGNEGARAEFCRDWFFKNGAKQAFIDSALNVVLPIGCDGDKPIIVIMAHTDTVFPDLEPFSVTVDGDIASCPGIGDDTASLSVMMILARYFNEHADTDKYGLMFVCDSGEEGLGNLKGVRKIVSDYGDRIACLISIDGTAKTICNLAVGSTRYKIVFKTEGGHSFANFGNKNAIAEMSAFINKLYQIEVPREGESRTTYNVGIVCGGTSVNTIAQHAEMMYEYRSDSAACLAEMKNRFELVLSEAKQNGTDIEVEIVGERPCMGEVDREQLSALSEMCADAYEAAFGFRPVFSSGSTDCNIPLSRGIPSVSIGGYIGRGAHTREEWVSLSSLKLSAEAVATVILNILE